MSSQVSHQSLLDVCVVSDPASAQSPHAQAGELQLEWVKGEMGKGLAGGQQSASPCLQGVSGERCSWGSALG